MIFLFQLQKSVRFISSSIILASTRSFVLYLIDKWTSVHDNNPCKTGEMITVRVC